MKQGFEKHKELLHKTFKTLWKHSKLLCISTLKAQILKALWIVAQNTNHVLKSNIPSMVWKAQRTVAQNTQHCVKTFKIVAQNTQHCAKAFRIIAQSTKKKT